MQLQHYHSNQHLFVPFDTGAPKDGVFAHISGLGKLARLDFERFAVAGETIFKIEGDAAPVSQADEEARIGSLAYALKQFGNEVDAAEFVRCLNAICAEGDARYRQMAASHYYREIRERDARGVLKEMGLLALQLSQLNAVLEVSEETEAIEWASEYTPSVSWEPELDGEDDVRAFFAQEVAAMARLTAGRRKAAAFAYDEASAQLDELEAGGASLDELDAAFATRENLAQYDECGAILTMSAHERTVACGRLEAEWETEDLPLNARYLAGELRRAYANGANLEETWDDINAQLDVLFPISGKTETGRFYSHANRELQHLTREILTALLAECQADVHLTALRTSRAYREFHKAIRGANDTRIVNDTIKRAYTAKQEQRLSLKHFTLLNTAAQLQRIRLEAAPLSREAQTLLREIHHASASKLRFLRWACYGQNQPQHSIHRLSGQEQHRVWQTLKERSAGAEKRNQRMVVRVNAATV